MGTSGRTISPEGGTSTGDGGCPLGGVSNNAREAGLLNGKILRITTDGAIPPGNPNNTIAGAVLCNASNPNPAGGACLEMFASGLRNPFKFAFKSGTDQFYINDVGQNTWEEIDDGVIGADYGWNIREAKHWFRPDGNDADRP